MRKVVLITTRDYPFKKDVLDSFIQQVDGITVYRDCLSTLIILTEEERTELSSKVTAEKSLENLTRRRIIGKLFKDQKADWTTNSDNAKGRTFNEFKTEGFPLLKRIIKDVTFYVLPCTGTDILDDSGGAALLRQKYTSNCVNLVCKQEHIERRELLAIIHSRDTGVSNSDMQSRVIKSGEQITGAPLEDISNVGHLYLFHHTAGHPIYDRIVAPLCCMNDENCAIEELNEFFPVDVVGWWDKLASLNNDSYAY